MKTLLLLLLCCHVTSTVKHSLKFAVALTSGVRSFPEFVGVLTVDGVVAGYCDSNNKTAEPKQDWMRKLIKEDPHDLRWYEEACVTRRQFLRTHIDNIKRHLNQTEGVHILQMISGCEWDNETGEVIGSHQFGYDGEDFIALDLKTLTWIALKPQADSTKLRWDAEKSRIESNKQYLINHCPDSLKKYVHYGRSFLQRKALPSVSLLQQTPSSPVRCFASGFYPERASLFWRKDGDDLHEDVELGEILPNTDGTFQMSVDLKVSSPEDWRRYECVFQLSGVKDDIVTKLDKTAIRTNWRETEIRGEELSHMTVPIIASVAVLVLILIAAVGFIIYRHRKKVKAPRSSPDSSSEFCEQMNLKA